MAFWDFLAKLFGGQAKPANPSEVRAALSSPPGTPARPEPVPSAPPPVGHQASEFLPIGRDQLLKEGEEALRAGWMWFGRRDMIPPASDPRTKLIDRGLLTQGYFSAKQLAEMHRVGDEWSKHANRMDHIQVQAGQSADAAVEADRAARAALKAQKKAEAAERKKQHADAVARRKATDIIFVGKGVSGLLGERASDIEKLTSAGLPVLQTPGDLAAALGLTIPRLRWLCFHTEAATRIHYVQFEVPKKRGGTRTLSAPHRTLASAQQWVLENILAKLPTEEAAHGFVPGRSTLTNARPHAARDMVVNLDLQDFFPSIGFGRVRNLFRFIGYSGAASTLLALLCTECPRRRVIYAGTPYFVATGPRGFAAGGVHQPGPFESNRPEP